MVWTTLTLWGLVTLVALSLALTTLMGYSKIATGLALLAIPISVMCILKMVQVLVALSGWSRAVTKVLRKVGLVKPTLIGGKVLSSSELYPLVYTSHNLLVFRLYEGNMETNGEDFHKLWD
tara:strand:- start:426 stop:788 length:363 start_codon:yes stop_codon:yes gene_type:complete